MMFVKWSSETITGVQILNQINFCYLLKWSQKLIQYDNHVICRRNEIQLP